MSSEHPATRPYVLVVFAKDPQPGCVKTRMTPALSPELAAAFYGEMLADVLAESARACAALGLDGVLAVTPADSIKTLAEFAPENFRIVAQSGSDLGARLAHEVSSALAMGASRVVLRGSDSPALGSGDIAQLIRALDTADLAVSPDLDGGYSAIGLRGPAREIFDHPMSTENVLRDTLERAEGSGLATCTTDGCFDLDTVEDLRHLARVRDSLPAERCPRTLAFADEHGLWKIAR
ncbi:MAG: TIGR04282 family arsenosugar biosynthesis glycosyltransferase [Myxococcales bacterium]|nr:TIGR04282 family arsenosugar biosynthesis glycosyltransferase [Myxococcales bacterium]